MPNDLANKPMPIPRFAPDHLEAISGALGDTGGGLTGTVIGRLLHELGYDDPGPITKRDRERLPDAASRARGRRPANVAPSVALGLSQLNNRPISLVAPTRGKMVTA